MTTTTSTTTATTTAAVDQLVAAIAAGRGREAVAGFAEDAVLDATVPNWRFTVRGAAAIGEQFAGWFDAESVFEQIDRRPLPDGVLVTYTQTWDDHGGPVAVHHCHVLDVDADGRIVRDTFWCGGRWDAKRLAEMEAAARDAG